MKKLIILLVVLSISVLSSYADDFLDSIPVNPKEYTKCEKCTAVLKSKLNEAEIWYDPAKWKIEYSKENSEINQNTYMIKSIKHDDYVGGVLFHNYDVNLSKAISEIEEGFNNERTSQQKVKEIVIINNKKVMCFEYIFDDSIFKPPYRMYYAYYYSKANKGVVNVYMTIKEKHSDGFRKEMMDFMSGLVVK